MIDVPIRFRLPPAIPIGKVVVFLQFDMGLPVRPRRRFIPTQLWAGFAYACAEELPRDTDNVIVDVGSSEAKYFVVKMETTMLQDKVPEQAILCTLYWMSMKNIGASGVNLM